MRTSIEVQPTMILIPKHMGQMPPLGWHLYAAMTIGDTILEPTKPEMMAALVAKATSMPRRFCTVSALSAHYTACAVHTAYSPPTQDMSIPIHHQIDNKGYRLAPTPVTPRPITIIQNMPSAVTPWDTVGMIIPCS